MHDPPDVVLSVIIPAYNEVDRIAGTVSHVLAFLDGRPYTSELIVVLDGGRPGAAEAIQAVAHHGRSTVTVFDNGRNRGKGFSVRRGVAGSHGMFVLFADADLSLPIENADRFVATLQAGDDVVIASRAVAGSVERGLRQPLRHALGRAFNWMVRSLLLDGIHDTQCGFKAFRGPVARSLFRVQRIDRFGFDVEVLRLARRRGLRIRELPVTCDYHPTSSVRRFRDGLAMLGDVALILWHDWRGSYDVA